MWPILLGKVVAAAALVAGGVVIFEQFQKHKQEQERQQVYWEPFELVQQPANSHDRIKEGLLDTVRIKLLEIRQMAPGKERSAAIRELRARYHPDRHVHLPMLADIFQEISKIINAATDDLMREDWL